MPNWTANLIRIEGSSERIAEFLAFMRGGDDQIFDFNRIIPMPELLRHTAMWRPGFPRRERPSLPRQLLVRDRPGPEAR